MPALLLIRKGEIIDRFLLPEGGVGIGSGAVNQIQLKSPSVSERHARIFTSDACSIIKDLNSALGTFVNDRFIHRCELRDNDMILIGSYKLRFQYDDHDDRFLSSANDNTADAAPADPLSSASNQPQIAAAKSPDRRNRPAQLLVLNGINEGQRLLLRAQRVVLGKEKRRELIIEASEEGYTASLAPGASEVLLNGAPLREPMVLGHTDELTLEDTTLRFEAAESPTGS